AAELIIANKELAFQNDEKEKRAEELGIANKELAFQNNEKEKRSEELGIANKELAFQNDEKEKRAAELIIANKELAFQNDEKEKRAEELGIANKELAFQNNEKEKRSEELGIANKELAFQNDEKEKRAAELIIANRELAFQNNEKEKRAEELGIANKELAFQNDEKEKRSEELGIANKELAFQNDEKEKRAQELGVANKELAFQNDEKEKRADELGIANTELAFQNDEKEKRAAELFIANNELAFQNDEKEKRAQELGIANKELAFQNDEKEKRAQELGIANTELAFQNDEKEKRAAELSIANTELAFQNDEKEKRAQELGVANKELAFQNDEKEKRAQELGIANTELAFQNDEKEKRAAELFIANNELAFQNDEKEKRAQELGVANKELAFQNDEKEKRAQELGIANTELAFQNDEKEKRAAELIIANTELAFQNDEKEKRAQELGIANTELAFQNDEKEKRAQELGIANTELAFQNDEKEKRAAELFIANNELAFQNDEKEKRAQELGVANKELAFQNDEKEKRAEELGIANKELAFQNDEKEKRAAELFVANNELAFQNFEKEKRAQELGIANTELAFQNDEKEKRAAELIIANKELAFQNYEKEQRAEELSVANKELAYQNDEKEKRAQELTVANKELAFQNDEKEKRAQELSIAVKELAFQNDEKEKRAAELVIANEELAFQKEEKEKRAAELVIANYARGLIEASLDPLVTISSEGKITDVNEATIKVTGVDREKLIGTDFSQYFTEEERARNGYQQVLKEGFVTNYPLTIKSSSGRLTDVLYNSSIYKDPIGNVLGIFAAARDVTETKQASQYARRLIEASLDPLLTISTIGKITDVNEATVKVTGLAKEKLINTDFFEYFTEPEMAKEVYQQVFARGSVADSPLTLRHKDGKLTDVLFTGSVYKDDRGNVLGIVVVARDITDQKRFENELIEAKKKAERATFIAEEAVKTKQQFLSNMSHEIRTPMNAIIGFTNVVLKTTLAPKQKEYLDAIKISGDALIVLINDILDLAKVDAGKMTFEQTPFKMSTSINAMLNLFETKFQEKNLKLVKEYDTNIPEVLVGDPMRLHQVILNLVSNAIKFTSEGQITVSVKLLEQDTAKAKIEFAITDTGIGIPEDKLDSIFDDFQQASSGTSRLYGGTGLGLAIVKSLIEPQGGTIGVRSIEGVGSTFSFTLSFLKTLATLDIDAGLEEDMGLEASVGIKKIKVLVVEDIALNQLLMRTLLEDFGFELDIASNGKIALDKLRETTYDIILMDLQMPVMGGFEATQYIRTEMKLVLPIIALTADVTTMDVEKCIAVGMNDYMSKPVDEKILYNKIIKFIKGADLMKAPDVDKSLEVMPKEKSINLDYLKKLTKNNASRMNEMIKIYLQETPQLVCNMKQAIDDKDWELLKKVAHSIIPSFSTMGIDSKYEATARQMQAIAGKLIEEKSEEVVTESSTLLNSMFSEIEQACARSCDEIYEEFPGI
ncbi:MAG TPA: PAS domain S-box protein, partial [Cytophagaceae bacterium]